MLLLQPTSTTAEKQKVEQESMYLSTTARVSRALHKKSFHHFTKEGTISNDFESVFRKPFYEWTLDEWITVGILAIVILILLCCLCNLLQCILGYVCSCCCGFDQRRRRPRDMGNLKNGDNYYQNVASAPLESRPPPYNPAYQARSGPSNYDAYQTRSRSEWGVFDCITAFCCLQCCSSQNGYSLRDLCCGLCCFELCCRGGRDVFSTGKASNDGYGTMAIVV